MKIWNTNLDWEFNYTNWQSVYVHHLASWKGVLQWRWRNINVTLRIYISRNNINNQMERFVKGKRQKRSRRNKLWFLNTNPNSTCLAFRPLTNVSDAVLKSPEKSFASSPWFGMYLFCQIKNGLSFCDNWEPKILLHLIRQPVCLFTLPSFGWGSEHHLIKRYHLNLLLNNVFSQQHSNVVGCLFLNFIVSHLVL